MAQNNRNGTHGDKTETFEQSFAGLQEVVQKLSDGNLTLQEALSAFEEGMALAESCTAMLDEAELRVKQVSERALKAASVGFEARAAEVEEPDLLAFEVETFESSIVFGPPASEKESRRRTSIQSEGTLAKDKQAERGTNKESRAATYIFGNNDLPDELDPLFDEDD